MAKKTKKGLESEHREVSTPSFYSNEMGVGVSEDTIVINFGLDAPSYFEPHDSESFPVARIVLPWSAAKGFLEILQKAISYYEKEEGPKRKRKSKVVKEARVGNGS